MYNSEEIKEMFPKSMEYMDENFATLFYAPSENKFKVVTKDGRIEWKSFSDIEKLEEKLETKFNRGGGGIVKRMKKYISSNSIKIP